MKYIRTKDTIFKVVDETDLVYRVKAKGNPHHIYSKSKISIYNVVEGNTIEELCDEFVFLSEKNTYIDMTHRFCDIPFMIRDYDDIKNPNIYGAIWTDTGLKYVAKMNEKGELELL